MDNSFDGVKIIHGLGGDYDKISPIDAWMMDLGDIPEDVRCFKMEVLERTCCAFPDQYEGKLANGRMIYIRLRNNIITVEISKEPTDNIVDAVVGVSLIESGFDNISINRTQLKQLFIDHGYEVDWSDCYFIDPYRIPNIQNYSLLGKLEALKVNLGHKVKYHWRVFKRTVQASSTPIRRRDLSFRMEENGVTSPEMFVNRFQILGRLRMNNVDHLQLPSIPKQDGSKLTDSNQISEYLFGFRIKSNSENSSD